MINIIKNFIKKIAIYFKLKKESKKIKQELRYIGTSKKKRKGLTLYAYDQENNVVYPVKIYKGKVILDKDHNITWALNLKNAIRKLKK